MGRALLSTERYYGNGEMTANKQPGVRPTTRTSVFPPDPEQATNQLWRSQAGQKADRCGIDATHRIEHFVSWVRVHNCHIF